MLLLLVLLVLQTTSEKALRKQLQEHFKTDMKEKKAFVKEHVSWRAAGGITAQQRRTAVQAAAALVGCSCQQRSKHADGWQQHSCMQQHIWCCQVAPPV